MIDREMNEFALLWRQESEPEEERLVETLARRARWRGRLLQYADIGGAIALAGGIAVAVLREGRELTALSGLLLVLAIAWQSRKRNALWDLEIGAASDRELLLSNAASAASARLKRTEISLLLLLPVSLAAMWFALGLYDAEVNGFGEALGAAFARPSTTLAYAAIVVALFAYLMMSRRRTRVELARIAEIGRQYGDEARLDRFP